MTKFSNLFIKILGTFPADALGIDYVGELTRLRKLISVSEKVNGLFFREPVLLAKYSSWELLVESKMKI